MSRTYNHIRMMIIYDIRLNAIRVQTGGIVSSESEIIFVCHQIMNQNQSDKQLSKRKWMGWWKRTSPFYSHFCIHNLQRSVRLYAQVTWTHFNFLRMGFRDKPEWKSLSHSTNKRRYNKSYCCDVGKLLHVSFKRQWNDSESIVNS